MGTIDMDSVPPATMTWAEPERMRSAARAMACRPEEQKRLMVIALVSTGRPARRAAMRATFMPCSPSGMAQPRITSSISLASRPGTRASASLMANAARSSGRVARSEPLKARPTGVRTAETMTASGMAGPRRSRFRVYCWARVGKKQLPVIHRCGDGPQLSVSSVQSGYLFSAYATNPSFVAFLDYLNIRVTGACEEFAILINAQERHACSRGVFFGELCSDGVGSFIDFRDEHGRATGLQDSEDFAHVTGQVGPPKVGFHGRDEIEHAVRKRQLRNRTAPDLDAAEIHPSCIGSLCCGDALVGIIDGVDFSLRGDRR